MSLRTTIVPHKWLNSLKFALIITSILLTGFQIWELYSEVYDVDFRAFETAIKVLLDGKTPYHSYVNELPFAFPQAFHYPLWTSFLYLPIAGLEHKVAISTWLVLNIAVLLPVTWLLQKLYLPDLAPVYVLPLYCISLNMCGLDLLDGFPNILLLGGFTLMLWAWKAGQPLLSGCWGGLALLIKPQLSLLVGLNYFLSLFLADAENRKRVYWWWVGGVVTGLVLLVSSWLIQPDWIGQLLTALREENLTGGVHADGVYYVWLTSTFPEWLTSLTGLEGLPINLAYGLFATSLLIFGIYRLVQWRNFSYATLALALALNIALIPYVRPYDFPLLLPALFWLIAILRLNYSQKRYYLAGFYFGIILLVFLIPTLNKDYRWYYFQPLLLTFLLLILKPPKFPTIILDKKPVN